jgi:hypothetical protein
LAKLQSVKQQMLGESPSGITSVTDQADYLATHDSVNTEFMSSALQLA